VRLRFGQERNVPSRRSERRQFRRHGEYDWLRRSEISPCSSIRHSIECHPAIRMCPFLHSSSQRSLARSPKTISPAWAHFASMQSFISSLGWSVCVYAHCRYVLMTIRRIGAWVAYPRMPVCPCRLSMGYSGCKSHARLDLALRSPTALLIFIE
jgi:hypothetical protein